ncbi:F0F1 ATP synthase subunit alpha [Anaeromyxobacter sp. Red801]|uniref:F0F1 ATP synthase subunit alpha n=1 Tax=Anaeromyxobacter sp. Red801 TaxID=3411632 RepID=UPI003B9ED0B3
MSGERRQGAAALASRLRQALHGMPYPRVVLECRFPVSPALLERVRETLSAAAGVPVAVELRVDPRLAAGASLLLGRGTRLDLDVGRALLDDVDRALAARPAEAEATLADARRRVGDAVEGAVAGLRLEDAADRGTVVQVGDGVATVRGLERVGAQEVVRFESGVDGIAFSLLDDAVGCLLLGAERPIAEGSAVVRTGRQLHVPVGDALVGRVVDALGRPIDGEGPIRSGRERPIERPSPGVVERRPVCESLHTGIKILDALVPLGRGQRELVLGDRGIGKTTTALDVILSQRGADVACVYAAIGQRASAVARTVALLQERGAMAYTTVLAACAGEPPAFRYVAPYAACAIAEEHMAQGRHALVVFDDLSKHAVTYREISALLQRPIGREAYPGDVFHVHSRLLERAARLRDDAGGGSLTAVPIVETLAGDVSAFIPTNVVSICDGQVFLDATRFNEGFRPAVDAGLSVSRVGGMAQSPAMRKVSGRLRVDLAQYGEMARFVKFGAEVDAATLQQLRRGERELELLKQPAHAPLPLEKEVVTLYAAVNGFADDVPLERIPAYEEALHRFMEARHPEVLARIRETGDLALAVEERLRDALGAFNAAFTPPAGGAAEGGR